MKALALLGLIAGLVLATVLVFGYGVDGIWAAASDLGWSGFAAVIGFHAVLLVAMGLAWWLLGWGRADARPGRFIWGRVIRDSASEVLPLSQVGGFVLGARAATLAGVSGAFAAASTAVDITAELVGQLAYTLLGLGLLAWVQPDNALAVPVLVGVGAMSALAAGFAVVQARGTGALERLGARLARDWLHVGSGRAGGLAVAMAQIYRRPWRLAASTLIHLGTWVLSGVETWLTLHLMGFGVPLVAALIIDSLLYGIRSLAFMVPNAVGVQEAALVMLGGLFGVGPDASIALSLVKRARDLAIGIPALLAWQMLEGKRAWHEVTPVAAPLVPGDD